MLGTARRWRSTLVVGEDVAEQREVGLRGHALGALQSHFQTSRDIDKQQTNTLSGLKLSLPTNLATFHQRYYTRYNALTKSVM